MAGGTDPTEPVRLDRWLWSVRVFKTRAAANDACGTGKVRLNGTPAKPAQRVRVGDLVRARRGDRTLEYRVVRTIEKRVSAALAAECYEDLSPPPPPRPDRLTLDETLLGHRERGEGRPTKRDRRRIDRLRGR